MVDDARYLSVADAPIPNTRLVQFHPLVRLDDDGAEVLAPERLQADFPNQGRVTWSRPGSQPRPGTLWWHRIQLNTGFMSGFRGSNRWLVDDAHGTVGPIEAIELLDLCRRFGDDDRRLRADLLRDGIALPWAPTRRVYLLLSADDIWIGPVDLLPSADADGGPRWRLDPALVADGVLQFPRRRAGSDADLMKVVLDGQERCFLMPGVGVGNRLPPAIWPTDVEALEWLAEHIQQSDAVHDAATLASLHAAIRRLAAHDPDGSGIGDDSLWLDWATRAVARLDLHDRAIETVIRRLLDAPTVLALRPPAPAPKLLEATRDEGYAAGLHEAEQAAAIARQVLEDELAEANAIVARQKQTMAEERDELDKAFAEAQRAGERRREAERQRDAARAELAVSANALTTMQVERDAACSERDAAQGEAAAMRAERDAARSESDAAQGQIVATQAERDLARGDATAAQTERDAAQSQVAAMQAERHAARGEAAAMQATARALGAERDAALTDLANERLASQGLRGELASARAELQTARAEIERMAADHAAERATWEQQTPLQSDALESSGLAQLHEMLADTQRQLADARADLAHQHLQDAEVRAERDRLRQDAESGRGERQSLQGQIQALRTKIAALEAQREKEIDSPSEIVVDELRGDMHQLQAEMQHLVDLVRTVGTHTPMPFKDADRPSPVAAWSPPWTGRPAPGTMIEACVVSEFGISLRNEDLPRSLARPIWRSIQARRVPVLAGEGSRAVLTALADLCFGGRELPVEIDPGLLSPSDLLGTLDAGMLRPSASRLADLLLDLSASAGSASGGHPVLLSLHGATRAPLDAYLAPLFLHYVRPAWMGQAGPLLGPLLPAALDAGDPYSALASASWPGSLAIAATLAEGAVTVPPPPGFWTYATFHCLEHAAGTGVAPRASTHASPPPRANGTYPDNDRTHVDSVATAVAVARACTTVTLHDLFGGGMAGDSDDRADPFRWFADRIGDAGVPVPRAILDSTGALTVRDFSVPDVLGSVLLPWAVTAGVDRMTLASLLQDDELNVEDSEERRRALTRLDACLGCMERLFR